MNAYGFGVSMWSRDTAEDMLIVSPNESSAAAPVSMLKFADLRPAAKRKSRKGQTTPVVYGFADQAGKDEPMALGVRRMG